MASVSYQIANLLEKMQSSDKDFRFMATNDLMTELQKDSIKLDDDSERKVVRMLLKLLEDKNGEVQNLAVKCLGPLVNKVKEFQVETIVESLCTNMISDKEQLRDISSIGLKTVIAELPRAPGGLSGNICKRITGHLTTAIEREDVSVQLEALDIVADLLGRFGSVLSSFHLSILNALLPQLNSCRQAVRKRTIVACSNLVLTCGSYLYLRLIDHLHDALVSTAYNGPQGRTSIQCIAAVCRQSGNRFGEYISRFVPLIMQYSSVEDDETREYCLQAFESFIRRCPKEITPHIPAIVELCLTYMVYDPNYNYDEEEDYNDCKMHADDEDDEEGNDEYSDDDDMSWKVRRAAAKCLESIICTRHELLLEFYQTLSPALIARFKEREENVKSDIFHAFIALLKQTKVSNVSTTDQDSLDKRKSPTLLLKEQVPMIVKSVQFQMKERSIKTRQDCFSLLKEICNALPEAFNSNLEDLIPGILYSLGERNSSSNMKIDSLSFIYAVVICHSPEVLRPHLNVLLPPVIAAVGDTFYKITAEALLVLQELVKVIRPLGIAVACTSPPPEYEHTPFTYEIYQCTLLRLKASDIDQEVKERAIATMGQIICNLGDVLKDQLAVCLPIFLDRLKNEITRLITVKALTNIASSPLRVDLLIINDALPVLGSFLRKNQRALKLSTLILLDCLMNQYYHRIRPDLLGYVLTELPPLLNESDLHVAQRTLTFLKSLANYHPRVLDDISPNIIPAILGLIRSPLLQGAALTSVLEFFQALVACNLQGLGYDILLDLLLFNVTSRQNNPSIHKQAYHSTAKCVAAITNVHQSEAFNVVNRFLHVIHEGNGDSQHVFALLVVGEIGRQIDLTSIPHLKEIILQSFSAVSEEVKSAASYALGTVALSNLPQYVPFILEEIESQPKRQYLLFHSLKEIITCLSSSKQGIDLLYNYMTKFFFLLMRHGECSEEGTRNVVAECLGKLVVVEPKALLIELAIQLESESPLMRATVVTAMKFTISDQPQEVDTELRRLMSQFLCTLQDPDLNVRRVALVAFNSAAHNKPDLVRDLLDSILPHLYNETKIKRELIREVEMGPFKHTVDDGLDLRKAAFECMYTLLETCLERIDVFEFLNHVEDGLKDHYDIKMLTYLMVARLAQICPVAVLQRVDKLIEPLRATCTMKVKANSVKQEYEKQDELKRSALRAVSALLMITDADKNAHLIEFVTQIKNSSDLLPIFESIQKDSVSSHSDHSIMDQS